MKYIKFNDLKYINTAIKKYNQLINMGAKELCLFEDINSYNGSNCLIDINCLDKNINLNDFDLNIAKNLNINDSHRVTEILSFLLKLKVES